MSKFTTDELIDALEVIVTEANSGESFRFHKENRKAVNAIIAKLRAADALCEAAKVAVLDCEHCSENLRKASKAYEEAGQ